jgi:porphobilinogen synthase
MSFPESRPRRLRRTENIRRLVRETRLSVDNFIYPIFVVPGKNIKKEITSLPGQYHLSADQAAEMALQAQDVGIPAMLLFGVPEKKDPSGAGSYDANSEVARAIRAIKRSAPDMTVMTDVCLCAYTSHGHCGLIEPETQEVANDESLEVLSKMALAHAEAGADFVAPSDMMDGRVGFIREGLDEEGFEKVGILSYAAKYASGFYGPFRDAAHSAPKDGDRRGYQMDPANIREALREVMFDIEEGADMVMVKPALAYLDIIQAVREDFDVPVAAYHVSGEYAMVKAAGKLGLIDEERVMMESLLAIRRAGADMILTYYALEAAKILARRPAPPAPPMRHEDKHHDHKKDHRKDLKK